MTTPDTIEAYSFTEMREALDTEAAQREMIAQARAEGKAEGARETAPSGRQGRDEGET